jgi:hypothetical protein
MTDNEGGDLVQQARERLRKERDEQRSVRGRVIESAILIEGLLEAIVILGFEVPRTSEDAFHALFLSGTFGRKIECANRVLTLTGLESSYPTVKERLKKLLEARNLMAHQQLRVRLYDLGSDQPMPYRFSKVRAGSERAPLPSTWAEETEQLARDLVADLSEILTRLKNVVVLPRLNDDEPVPLAERLAAMDNPADQ